MQEKEFARYVQQEKDIFCKFKKDQHPKLEEYMRDFTQKEIAMRSDKEWNVMLPKDAMVMALVNALDSKSNKKEQKFCTFKTVKGRRSIFKNFYETQRANRVLISQNPCSPFELCNFSKP